MKIEQITNKVKHILQKHLFRQNNQITYVEAKEIIRANPMAILLDVRSKQEYDEYHLDGAICIPNYEIAKELPKIIENKKQTIIVYCQSGGRSKKAISLLKKMGYQNLYEIEGGIDNL